MGRVSCYVATDAWGKTATSTRNAISGMSPPSFNRPVERFIEPV